MSDAAAFFAQKKKKKAFKFNANLVDASSVTSSVHVDAPALSTEQDPLSVVTAAVFSTEIKDPFDPIVKGQDNSELWDDEALVANTFKKSSNLIGATQTTSVGLRDMKSLDPKRIDPDNIAEKLRVEETKAQLAAAREGMEREAAKLKEERERKENAKMEAEKVRFGLAGGKWVAPHLRASGANSMSKSRMSSSTSQKLDVQDEELFPDLAAAEKILEKKERDQAPLFKAPKKTPVGGGASWASKPVTKQTATAAPEVETKVDTIISPDPAPEVVKEDTPKEIESAAPLTDNVAAPVVPKKTVVKKKKKDLSTFKPGA